MAVNKDLQGKSIGKQLFDFGVNLIKPKEIWLNSRTNAVGFYKKLGFQVTKETMITIPVAGKRYRMVKRLNYSE